MYLTALHVVSTSGGGEGVNTFLHLHTDASFPAGDLSAALVVKVAESFPGILIEESVQVPAGGNDVYSYLDVVVADGTSPSKIRAALEAVESELPSESLPLIKVLDGSVGILLNANIGLWPTMAKEYAALKTAILRLLDSWEARQGG